MLKLLHMSTYHSNTGDCWVVLLCTPWSWLSPWFCHGSSQERIGNQSIYRPCWFKLLSLSRVLLEEITLPRSLKWLNAFSRVQYTFRLGGVVTDPGSGWCMTSALLRLIKRPKSISANKASMMSVSKSPVPNIQQVYSTGRVMQCVVQYTHEEQVQKYRSKSKAMLHVIRYQ